MQVETVRVVSPVTEENDLGYIVINKSDLTDEHELFDDQPENDDVHIGKGPGGRLYVKRGRERVSGPYETKAEAEAALAKEQAA